MHYLECHVITPSSENYLLRPKKAIIRIAEDDSFLIEDIVAGGMSLTSGKTPLAEGLHRLGEPELFIQEMERKLTASPGSLLSPVRVVQNCIGYADFYLELGGEYFYILTDVLTTRDKADCKLQDVPVTPMTVGCAGLAVFTKDGIFFQHGEDKISNFVRFRHSFSYQDRVKIYHTNPKEIVSTEVIPREMTTENLYYTPNDKPLPKDPFGGDKKVVEHIWCDLLGMRLSTPRRNWLQGTTPYICVFPHDVFKACLTLKDRIQGMGLRDVLMNDIVIGTQSEIIRNLISHIYNDGSHKSLNALICYLVQTTDHLSSLSENLSKVTDLTPVITGVKRNST